MAYIGTLELESLPHALGDEGVVAWLSKQLLRVLLDHIRPLPGDVLVTRVLLPLVDPIRRPLDADEVLHLGLRISGTESLEHILTASATVVHLMPGIHVSFRAADCEGTTLSLSSEGLPLLRAHLGGS